MFTEFYHAQLFTSDEINKILNHMEEPTDTSYPVYMDGKYNDVGCKMQSSDLKWNSNIDWFFIKLSNWINTLNTGIKLVSPPHAVFRKYVVGDFFIKHTDQPPSPNPKRYMSVCIQLSNESEYEGGDVYVYAKDNKEHISKKVGYTYGFGIKVPHEVTPITKGTRKSLTIFISENHIKRTSLL